MLFFFKTYGPGWAGGGDEGEDDPYNDKKLCPKVRLEMAASERRAAHP